MSNLLINIRIFTAHLQLERGKLLPRITLNPCHKVNGWPDGYVSIYEFFGLV